MGNIHIWQEAGVVKQKRRADVGFPIPGVRPPAVRSRVSCTSTKMTIDDTNAVHTDVNISNIPTLLTILSSSITHSEPFYETTLSADATKHHDFSHRKQVSSNSRSH